MQKSKLMEWLEGVPILQPLFSLMFSRKMLLAVAGFFIALTLAYAPALEAVQNETLAVVVFLFGLVILAIGWQDGIVKEQMDLLGEIADEVQQKLAWLSEIPVVAPIVNALRNREVVTAVIAAVVDLIIANIPDLAEIRPQMIAVTTFLAMFLIGANTLETTAEQRARNGV